MTGFEPRTTGVGSDSHINWATATGVASIIIYNGRTCIRLATGMTIGQSYKHFTLVIYDPRVV